MRFEIASTPSGGLQVLPAIPAGRIQRLEGRNGIGKTVAVHLLQLCTGTQPYVGKNASWSTLRTQLGNTRITVSELADGDTLEFHLEPGGWPDEPDPVGEWLGLALYNSGEISWRDVPAILRVTRIGGDQTLGESLAGRVAIDRERLRSLTNAQEVRRHLWSDQATKLIRHTSFAHGVDLKRLRADASEARGLYGKAKKDLDWAQERVDGIRAASDLLAKADRLQHQLPELEAQGLTLANQEDELRRQIETADDEVARRLAATEASKDQADQVSKLSSLHRLRRDRRLRRRFEVDARAAAAGVETPVDLAAVAADKRRIQTELNALRDQRLAVDRVGLTLELIADVGRPLARANDRGLGTEVIAERVESSDLTVAALVAGIEERRQTLGNVSSDAARLLADEINVAEQRLVALAELPNLVRLRDKAEADLAETEEELASIMGSFGGGASRAYREALDGRAVLLDQLTDLSVRRGDVEAQMSALTAEGSVEELRVQAAAILQEFQLSIELSVIGVAAALPNAIAQVDAALEDLGAAHRRRDETAGRLLTTESLAGAGLAALREDESLAWLDMAPLNLLPTRDANPDDQIRSLAKLEQVATELNEALLATLNDAQALGQALESLASRLRTMNVGRGTGAFAGPLRRHYEAVFGDELAEPQLSEALFDDSTDVTVDLQEMSVAWQTKGGARQSRPLESFSSGQRAFAYTRVQMERQADEHSRNRMLVLDEFGAFIARDRFDLLIRYLNDRAIGDLADQILLILPMRQRADDIAELSPEFSGDGYIVLNDLK